MSNPIPIARPQAVFAPQPRPFTVADSLPPATVALLTEMSAR